MGWESTYPLCRCSGMSFVPTVCPNCKAETMADDTRRQCYCILCGYRYEVTPEDKGEAVGASLSDGKVQVTFVSDMAHYSFTVFIDEVETCFLSKGVSETVRIRPGRHMVRVKASTPLMRGTQAEGELKEGSKVTVGLSFLGPKIIIE